MLKKTTTTTLGILVPLTSITTVVYSKIKMTDDFQIKQFWILKIPSQGGRRQFQWPQFYIMCCAERQLQWIWFIPDTMMVQVKMADWGVLMTYSYPLDEKLATMTPSSSTFNPTVKFPTWEISCKNKIPYNVMWSLTSPHKWRTNSLND